MAHERGDPSLPSRHRYALRATRVDRHLDVGLPNNSAHNIEGDLRCTQYQRYLHPHHPIPTTPQPVFLPAVRRATAAVHAAVDFHDQPTDSAKKSAM